MPGKFIIAVATEPWTIRPKPARHEGNFLRHLGNDVLVARPINYLSAHLFFFCLGYILSWRKPATSGPHDISRLRFSPGSRGERQWQRTTFKEISLMPDRFANSEASLSGPASSGFSISPSDVNALPETTRALYVGAGGSLSMRMLSGETLTLSNVTSGSLLPLRVTHVFATGTTAGAIAGLL
jgi:hypothetical protein